MEDLIDDALVDLRKSLDNECTRRKLNDLQYHKIKLALNMLESVQLELEAKYIKETPWTESRPSSKALHQRPWHQSRQASRDN